MTKLTERNAEKYVATGGKICPFCESDKVVNDGNIFFLDEGVAQHIRCLNCGKGWRDIYRLTGILYEEYVNEEWDTQEFDFFK